MKALMNNRQRCDGKNIFRLPGWAWLFVHYLLISKHAIPDTPAETPETFALFGSGHFFIPFLIILQQNPAEQTDQIHSVNLPNRQ